MIAENFLIWNVRGLNARARRNVVRDLIADQGVSLVSLQETKLDLFTDVKMIGCSSLKGGVGELGTNKNLDL